MIDALELSEKNDDLWVLIVTNNGPAFCAGADIKKLAAGTEIVLACDLVVASEHSAFGLPETGIGITANGGLLRICRQVPLKFAMEMALTGEPISAAQAAAPGQKGRVQKLDMNIMYPSAAWDVIEYYTSLDLATEDKIEGNAAFVEKRKPVWKCR